VVVLAIGVTTSLTARMATLEAERASWGTTQPVLVVVERVDVGETVADAVELRDVPEALAPRGVVAALDPAAVARVPLFPGELLLGDRITTGDASFATDGAIALTVPVVRQVPLIEVGSLVDLWIVDGANLSSLRVAERVAVLAFSEDDLTVAVPPEQVVDATAASLRPVTVTLVG